MYLKNKSNKGFSHTLVAVLLVVVSVIGLAGYKVHTTANQTTKTAPLPAPAKVINQPQEQIKVSDAQPHITPPPTAPTSPKKFSAPPPAPAPKAPPAPPFSTSIQIKGDAACQSSTLNALKLLSTHAPLHYAVAVKYITIIECASQGTGMYAYENPPRYLVGSSTRDAGTVWYASTIAHDAGHSKLYHDYLSAHPGQSVPNDVWTGESAERTCLEAQHDALSRIGGTQYQLDYVKNVINSQYYDVPYDQRWW